jgi:small subunit ribosomal protein S16
MIKIRLRRVGAKKQPHYRVVVADARSPRDGRFIEIIGHYDPRQDPPAFKIMEDRAIHWLQQGAQPTDAVVRMLEKLGTYQKLERVRAGELLADIMAEAAVAAPEPAEVVEAAPPEEITEVPAPTAGPTAAMSLEELGFSGRVLKVLTEAGLSTAQDVLDKLAEGRDSVLAIPGLGEKSLEEIEEALRTHGLLK